MSISARKIKCGNFFCVQIFGEWDMGWALDFHNAVPVAPDEPCFRLPRTKLGEFLYRLKFEKDLDAADAIVENLVRFWQWVPEEVHEIAAIIPVPPGNEHRELQPVKILAHMFSERIGVRVADDYIFKLRSVPEIKKISSFQLRREAVRGAFSVVDTRFEGASVLLFDDLVRSGATMGELARLLREKGKVAEVFALAVTVVSIKE